jgi:superfamily II DNA/RNA helicase
MMNDEGPKISKRIVQSLLNSVQLNRVTIVIGPTGCGKSTVVPVELMDGLASDGPILCTQPRRLAVVAVASRVAQMRKTVLGGSQVGYHVGQHNRSTKDTALVFATAGILLEDLRANGMDVLKRYACILIDECHERSTESDLCLVVIKQLMLSHPNETIRVVLMSATFDHARYKKYFQAIPGCEVINTVTIETAESFTSFYNNVSTYYLDDVIPQLPDSEKHLQYGKLMKKDPSADLYGDGTDNGRSLSPGLLSLISSLVAWLDAKEDRAAPYLLFAPTYRNLEQIYEHLISNHDFLVLSVLHSSVDIEDCLRSMKQQQGLTLSPPKRRVFLASAIADSSITIPGVSCVIDTCRSLQVYWDGTRRKSQIVWTSQSICDQRKGRTGRTNPGRVYRLLPKGVYLSNKVPEFEIPQLTLSDCRNEAMGILASSSRDIKDTEGLLGKCLDPPESITIQHAFSYLKDIGACVTTGGQRSKLAATEYGTLLATLPFNVEESRVILSAARHGYLHEMLLLLAIQTISPSPIVTYFADRQQSAMALQKYKSDVSPKDSMSVLFAHMSAFMFWDADWNYCRRQSAYSLFHRLSGGDAGSAPVNSYLEDSDLLDETLDRAIISKRRDCGVWQWTIAAEESHIEWCRRHQINPTSVRAVADTIDVTMKILYQSKFEPAFLRCCPAAPTWQRRGSFKFPPQNGASTQMLHNVYGDASDLLCQTLIELYDPDAPNGVTATIRQPTQEQSQSNELCIHFLNGKCRYGARCMKAHTQHGTRPICKFFVAGDCSNGDKCMFSHERGPPTTAPRVKMIGDPLAPLVPQHESMILKDGAKGWFLTFAKNLVLFGENNFMFSASLAALGVPPRMSTEFARVDTSSNRFARLDSNRVRAGVDATRIHANAHLLYDIVHDIRGFAWNFPFTGDEEDEGAHEDMILATFLSLGLFSRNANIASPQFALTLQGDQLSRWSVLRTAHSAGWALKTWGTFDHADFPGYRPCRASGDPFPYERGRLYVFELLRDIIW